jgi:hypothetical protein
MNASTKTGSFSLEDAGKVLFGRIKVTLSLLAG